jgi:hypothetical protein
MRCFSSEHVVIEEIVMIAKWFRNRWEGRFRSRMGRISYPPGKQPRFRSLTTPTNRTGSEALAVVGRSDAKRRERGVVNGNRN